MSSTDREGATTTRAHRRLTEELTRKRSCWTLPAFLRQIVERVVQQMLEVEMIEPI
jgi:hypothetical protein